MTIQKSNIKYIFSKVLNDLDDQLVKTVQTYIQNFKRERGRNPRDMAELTQFLTRYNIQRIPQPSSGQYQYNRQAGTIKVIKTYNATPEKLSQSAGIGDDKPEENKEEDVFEFNR